MIIGNYDEDVFFGYLSLVAAMIRLSILDLHSDNYDNKSDATQFLKSPFIDYLCDVLDINKKEFQMKIFSTKKIWHKKYD